MRCHHRGALLSTRILFLAGMLELGSQVLVIIVVGTYLLKRWPAPTLLFTASLLIAGHGNAGG